MMKLQKLIGALSLVAIAVSATTYAQIAPGQPYSTWQKWSFDAPEGDGSDALNRAPDANSFMAFDGNGDPGTPDGIHPTQLATSVTSANNPVFINGALQIAPGTGQLVQVENWRDEEPLKIIELYAYALTPSALHNLNVELAAASKNDVAIPSTSFFSEGPVMGSNQNGFFKMWYFEIVPNPWWEQFFLSNTGDPQTGEPVIIDMLEIHTVSLPEPGTYALLGTCLGVVAAARRRRVTA